VTRFFPSYGLIDPPPRQHQRIGQGGTLEIHGAGDPFIRMLALTTGSVIRFFTGHDDEVVNGYLHGISGTDSGNDFANIQMRPPQFSSDDVRPYIAQTTYDTGESFTAVGLRDESVSPSVIECATYWTELANNTDYIIHYANTNYWYDPTGATAQMTLNSSGDLSVVGALSKGSGSFDIEHPTLEGYRLRHSFIEGPQADLIYRGTVTLADSSTVIDLDEEAGMTDGTWEALCRDPWSLVSTPGGVVDWSLESKYLTITGDVGATCSWIVMAERTDPHIHQSSLTDDNGSIVVEYISEEVPPKPRRSYDSNNKQMG
jgi:hypothetical protein